MTELLSLENLLAAGRDSAHPVAQRNGTLLTFGDFARAVAGWQAAFARQPGERWALYYDDAFVFAAALFGAWHAGKCVYLPSDNLPGTLARLREVVDGFAGDLPTDCSPLCTMDAPVGRWQTLQPATDALVVYTSGSTGEPSAIPKRLAQLANEINTQAQLWAEKLTDACVLSTVSHQHIYGLLFRILLPLAAGRPFASGRLAFPEDIAAALASSGPALLIASPAHLKRLPDQLPWAAGRAALRAVFSSGGPLPDEALRDCRELLGQAPIEIYGSSETGGIAWRQRDTDAVRHWQTLPGIAVRIVDGTLQVQSPHLRDADWQSTDDIVDIDANGFVLLGRADRIVKIEEKRVSLTAMERAIQDTGLLSEVRLLTLPSAHHALAVVGVPSAAGWALFDEAGKRGLSQALRRALADILESSVLPRRWRFVSALPSNSQGKTTQTGLLALFDPRRPATRLLSHDAHNATLHIDVAAKLPFFDGHFTSASILPGVTQLEWAILFGRELFPLPPAFLRMETVKFQQVIVPGTQVCLELSVKTMPDTSTLTFKLSSTAGQHASGRVVFGATP